LPRAWRLVSTVLRCLIPPKLFYAVAVAASLCKAGQSLPQSIQSTSFQLNLNHLKTTNAPSPRSSGHRAAGIRAGSAELCFRGRPSCRLSVQIMTGGASGAVELPIRDEIGSRSCREDVPCHCEEWRGVCAVSRGQWVDWCCVGQSEVVSNDPAAEGAASGLGKH
jgi:hypothetical protein